jgi:hypothetical protein
MKASDKVAIMQPYFLPYLGYYSLIKHVDRWIFNDEVQMIHKGWVERNRILKQYGGWHYIRVPLVKFHHTTLIKHIRIRNNEKWKEKILAQLQHYKKTAPYYWKVIGLLKTAFEPEFETITAQNAHLLKLTCEYIGFDFKYEILSDLNMKIEEVDEPVDWSLIICKKLDCKSYINPILGKSFYNRKKFRDNNIKLDFLKSLPYKYDQGADEFIGGLSIVDVMMFNTPEEVLTLIDNYQLV